MKKGIRVLLKSWKWEIIFSRNTQKNETIKFETKCDFQSFNELCEEKVGKNHEFFSNRREIGENLFNVWRWARFSWDQRKAYYSQSNA